MASMTRLGSLSSLTIALALLAGCGSDSGGVIGPPQAGTGGHSHGSGGKSDVDGSAAGASSHKGGASSNAGGTGNAGGDTGSGGADSAGGDANGGADAGPSGGGTGIGGADASAPGAGGSGNGGTAGASGSGNGGSGAGGASATCNGVKCDATATCTANKCVCPGGTVDKNGNGTKCTKPNGGTCGADADCTNAHCVGGSCCGVACTTPGTCEQAAGTVCVNGNTCQYGKKLDGSTCDDGDLCTANSCFDGACVVDSTVTCQSTKCATLSCNPASGQCTVSTPVICNDSNSCTTDTCSATLGCQFTPNSAACNDANACTSGDVCTGGTCKGTAVNINDNNVCTTDACNPATGPTHTNNTLACDDGSACTATDKCSGGVCVGSGNACGAIATGCVTCTGTPPPAGCYEPTPPQGRNCTCPATSGGTPVLEQNGLCVLNTDECASNPCGALATGCNDPTPSAPAAKDYQCTCPAGTTGNTVGSPCVDKNECTGGPNPCGVGTCTNLNPPNFYGCACQAGYRSTPTATGPVCSCDLGGTYAESVTTTISWNNVGGGVVENPPAGGVPAYGWSLRQHTIAADGTLSIVTVPCGGMAPTLCNTNGTDAYAQYQPVSSWGKIRMRSGFQPIVVAPTVMKGAIPGGTYSEPQTASLLGIDLKDPAGAWPPCRACVGPAVTSCSCGGTTYNITNTATWWSNAEGTNKSGVTTFAVRAGGEKIGDATLPDPPVNYGVPSECPRTGTPAADYSPWPGYVPLLDFYATTTWYGASRIISSLASTSITFDATASACVINGNVGGPDTGNKAHSDARVAGCDKTNGACTIPPGSDEVGFYDTAAQSQSIVSSTFKLEKAPASINLATILAMADPARETAINNACQTIRVKYCPPGRTCQ